MLEHIYEKEKLWLSFFSHFCVALYPHWISNTTEWHSFLNFYFYFTLFDVTWYVLGICSWLLFSCFFFLFFAVNTTFSEIRFPNQTKCRYLVYFYVLYNLYRNDGKWERTVDKMLVSKHNRYIHVCDCDCI